MHTHAGSDPCPLCEKSDRSWIASQALRVLQLVIAAGVSGASCIGLMLAQTPAIGERVRAAEVQIDAAQVSIATLTPRVDKLEQELSKLYGIGIAVGVALGSLNAGQLVIAVRRKSS